MTARQGGKTTWMEFLLFTTWAWWGLGFVRFPRHVEFMASLDAYNEAIARRAPEVLHEAFSADVWR